MPITQQQKQAAQATQHAAAHDPSPQVRLVSGPGTGKTFTIQERVRWLLDGHASPDHVRVVSFTRAAAVELQARARAYCQQRGQPGVGRVSVSTLHSLALGALRKASLLAYPTNPMVMDSWELRSVLDAEFSRASGYGSGQAGVGYSPGRCAGIRREYDALCCGTGTWPPPSYVPPNPPITPAERADYRTFHTNRTQTYSCVLPGEIIRQCVVRTAAGALDPAALLDIRHLIVDEYQDLNPADLEFVEDLIRRGVCTFIAGDDDQSIYSFRYASPEGIQTFTIRHLAAGDHRLQECFRCTPKVLGAALALMTAFSSPNRIPKQPSSLYANAAPCVHGVAHRWRFPSAVAEAKAIAGSCSKLISGGLPPREIMILVSSRPALLSTLAQKLEDADVAFDAPRADSFIDTRLGRFILAILRVVSNPDDYVAHRLILGLRPRVGPTICNSIADAVIAHGLNYRDLFYRPLPPGVFRGRQLTSLNHARATCARMQHWLPTETLGRRSSDILGIVSTVFGQPGAQEWQLHTAHLPQGMTLEEVRDYLWADSDEQQALLLEAVHTRLGLPLPGGGVLPQKVRVMTMHGAKGLSGSVVFIPGLMKEVLPGAKRRRYPGLVSEAARMLYVSITRARAACILTYARTRVVYGKYKTQTPSRFTSNLGGPFVNRNAGLSDPEADEILQFVGDL